MTTFAFQPSNTVPFQFQPTLDGDIYSVIVTWNLFGQRYYVNIYQDDGTLVVCLPMIGSPADRDISLTAGYFDSVMVFRQQDQTFVVTP